MYFLDYDSPPAVLSFVDLGIGFALALDVCGVRGLVAGFVRM